MRVWLPICVLAFATAAACTSNNPASPDNNKPQTRISSNPGSLSFNQLGQSGNVTASFTGSTVPPPDSFWHFTSSNPSVASVSNASSPTQTVTAVGNGTTTIHITLETVNDTADIPVTVSAPLPTFSQYNGMWKGDANLQPLLGQLRFVSPAASCAGSLNAYGETATINVNASGAGTFTMTDTPGFDRAYQVSIPSNLTFSSSGTFSFLGLAVPGKLSVTISSTSKLTFQEATTYGSCTNTYGGTLTKQ
jgi:hypothetical protein